MEYVIGTSSVARGLSGYIDFLCKGALADFWKSIYEADISFLAEYPDFLSFGVIIVLAIVLSVGVRESSMLNNVFTIVNLLTIAVCLIAGGMNASVSNWSIDTETVNATIPEGTKPEDVGEIGEGGFMPFGLAGIMAGAAKCFYGFVGFDCVATTGEEAINPKRNIPLAIVTSLIIIFLAYFGISTVLTMMLPYYLQNIEAPFPHAFELIGWTTVKWIVSIGAIFALSTSLLGAMFPLPRVLYAMGNDGVIFKIFKRVHAKTQTPMIATILSGLLAAAMALLFSLHQLIDMMSIGTLMAYTIVAICVLILRYNSPHAENDMLTSVSIVLRQLTNYKFTREPSNVSSNIAKVGVVVYGILCIAFCGILKFDFNAATITLLSIVGAALVLNIVILSRQPVDTSVELSFKVPLVPLLPCVSILVNLYLMFQLDSNTWIRFGVWLVLGKL